MNRIIDSHPIEYWQDNAMQCYLNTPAAVLDYIDKLEQLLSSPTQRIYPKDQDFKKLVISMEEDHISITGLNE